MAVDARVLQDIHIALKYNKPIFKYVKTDYDENLKRITSAREKAWDWSEKSPLKSFVYICLLGLFSATFIHHLIVLSISYWFALTLKDMGIPSFLSFPSLMYMGYVSIAFYSQFLISGLSETKQRDSKKAIFIAQAIQDLMVIHRDTFFQVKLVLDECNERWMAFQFRKTSAHDAVSKSIRKKMEVYLNRRLQVLEDDGEWYSIQVSLKIAPLYTTEQREKMLDGKITDLRQASMDELREAAERQELLHKLGMS